ncbi:ATP synthase F0 subunit C [bacterium]|nr:ATP synthase F0 subunit C [bacterium]
MKKINLALLATSMTPALAFAQDGMGGGSGAKFWAAGLCMGLAAVGVAFSQSRAAHAALEGIGRNPVSAKQSFVPLILSLALMEALALFAFLVSNSLISA